MTSGTSLVAQWFRLCPSNAGGEGFMHGGGPKILVGEIRFFGATKKNKKDFRNDFSE